VFRDEQNRRDHVLDMDRRAAVLDAWPGREASPGNRLDHADDVPLATEPIDHRQTQHARRYSGLVSEVENRTFGGEFGLAIERVGFGRRVFVGRSAHRSDLVAHRLDRADVENPFQPCAAES